MALKASIIQSFASFILGSDTFERVKNMVSIEDENSHLSGAQKRENVIKDLKIIGSGIASWALNLAIELAVAWFRTKAGEKPNVGK